MITFIDLFAGIGGFRLGLERNGMKCVFSSEIDKYCQQTYEANFGEKPHGDITLIEAKDIPKHDILAAGFPCQPFSVAGKRLGFDDDRGNLFCHIIRIAEYHKPKVIFLENVRGLLSHNKGETLRYIRFELALLGYNVFNEVLKACDYGLPTLRPRLYIVAIKIPPIDSKFEFPQPIPLRFTMSDILKVRYCEKDIGYTIRQGGRSSGIGTKHNWDEYLVKNIVKTNGIFFIENEIRKLTLDEMKMMMGFPEDFKFPVSKTQAMKQIGNSVAIDVIKAIGEQMLKVIEYAS